MRGTVLVVVRAPVAVVTQVRGVRAVGRGMAPAGGAGRGGEAVAVGVLHESAGVGVLGGAHGVVLDAGEELCVDGAEVIAGQAAVEGRVGVVQVLEGLPSKRLENNNH